MLVVYKIGQLYFYNFFYRKGYFFHNINIYIFYVSVHCFCYISVLHSFFFHACAHAWHTQDHRFLFFLFFFLYILLPIHCSWIYSSLTLYISICRLPYLREATALGMGIVIMNPGANMVTVGNEKVR